MAGINHAQMCKIRASAIQARFALETFRRLELIQCLLHHHHLSPSLHAPLGLGLRGEQERERRGGAAVHRGFSGHSGEWKRSLAALQIVQTRGTKEAHHDGFCMIDEMRHDHE